MEGLDQNYLRAFAEHGARIALNIVHAGEGEVSYKMFKKDWKDAFFTTFEGFTPSEQSGIYEHFQDAFFGKSDYNRFLDYHCSPLTFEQGQKFNQVNLYSSKSFLNGHRVGYFRNSPMSYVQEPSMVRLNRDGEIKYEAGAIAQGILNNTAGGPISLEDDLNRIFSRNNLQVEHERVKKEPFKDWAERVSKKKSEGQDGSDLIEDAA